MSLFTIGHSTRSLDELVGLLRESGVSHLVDVRTVPRSRTNPQFNMATLPEALAPYGLTYEHVAALGGLRNKSRDVPAALNGYWTNESFHHYADYALTEPYHLALGQLIATSHQRVSAVMCAEAVWWRCHRRIIADYVLAQDEPVFHIMGPGEPEVARLTPGAVIRPDRSIVYPAVSEV